MSCQLLDRGLNLLFLDTVVLVIFIFSGKALPGQRTLEEVKQYVADRLHIISSGLLNADMSVD